MTDLTSPPSFGSGDLAALFGDVIQDGRLLTIDSPLGPDMLLLERLVGEEALSEPFRFELTVRAKRDDIASAELVGHRVSFTLERADGSRRPWSGRTTVCTAIALVAGSRVVHGMKGSRTSSAWSSISPSTNEAMTSLGKSYSSTMGAWWRRRAWSFHSPFSSDA